MADFAAVIFDLNGTLIHQIRTERSHMASTYAALASYRWDITFESFEEAWVKVHSRYAEQFREGVRLLRTRRFEEAREQLREPWYRENISGIVAELGLSVPNRLVEKITWAFQDSWVGGLTMPEENRGVLERLARGYRLGIVTNFQQPNIIPDILKQFEIQDFFGSVVVSATVGYRKPHPDLFKLALSELDMTSTPERVAYVGDDPQDDVEGATLAGLYPILIDTNERHLSSTNSVGYIRRLMELPDALRTLSPRLPQRHR